jgi:DnaA-like protein
MGNAVSPSHSPRFYELILRGRRRQALVQIDDDWRALGDIATRTLFWCRGHIHGCRCEADEMRFAVQVTHSSISAFAQHISGAYAIRLRRLRGWQRGIFKHYVATELPDESHVDELVRRLHGGTADSHVWTGAGPAAEAWITDPSHVPAVSSLKTTSNIETIARVVAEHCGVSFDEMRSASRKRTVSKAKVIATVLCTRRGATAAAAARLFRRSRSTLIERAEHYRRTQPRMFAEAERALSSYLDTRARQRDTQ